MGLHDRLPSSALDDAMTAALRRRRHASTLRQLSLPPAKSVDFSSNDFLSLSTSPLHRSTFLQELDRNASLPLASGGSRLLDGNTPYALALERMIATHHNAPSALLTNSGYDANVAIFSTLPQPRDVVIYDSLIHASAHDGMRASRAPSTNHFAFAHNDVASFAAVLAHVMALFPAIAQGQASIFVALEAIYSMDGDVAPLAAIIAVLDETLTPNQRRNVHLIVDEAHATGVLGARGAGLVCSLALENRVAIRLHTFGKALAANGAAILCDATTRSYLLNYARSLIYTTFMSFPALALARSAYELLAAGRTEPLAARLRQNMASLHAQLTTLQHELHLLGLAAGSLLHMEQGEPQSPIFSVHTVDPRGLAAHCQRKGFVVRPIMPPTVPQGSERVRVCLHAGNTDEEVRALVGAMRDWCRDEAQRRRRVESGVEPPPHSEHVDRAKL